jgi:hypothetical protein
MIELTPRLRAPAVALAACLLAAGCAHAPAAHLPLPGAPAKPAVPPPGPAAAAEAEVAPPAAAEEEPAPPAEVPPAPPAEAPAAPPAEAPPAPPAERPLTVAAVGDVMLGSTFPDESKGSLLPPDDGAGLLLEVAPVLRAADLAFGNLEGPLLDAGPSEKCRNARPGRCYAFRVPERYGQLLARAGFKVMSLANNHVGDFGEAGKARTRSVLDALGIRYSGAAGEAALLEVRGRRIALVAFSVSSGTNDLRDVEGAARLVAELRAQADLVLVSFHGGAEGAQFQHVPPGPEAFYGEERGDLRRFAHAVVDAGAALVLGHGPHVVRGLELYRGRLVAYSLGNFATYGGMNLSGPNGLTLVLEVQLAPDGAFLGGRIHPAMQERPGGPRWDAAGAVLPVIRRLSQEDFGAAAPAIGDDGAVSPPASLSGG